MIWLAVGNCTEPAISCRKPSINSTVAAVPRVGVGFQAQSAQARALQNRGGGQPVVPRSHHNRVVVGHLPNDMSVLTQ